MEYNVSGRGSCSNSHIINLNRSCTTYSKNNIISKRSKSNIMSMNSIIGFGRYKGYTIKALLKCIDGVNYLKWATAHDIFKLNEYAKNKLNGCSCYKMCCNQKDFLKVYNKNDIIDFGKYKGKTIDYLLSSRPETIRYLNWLWENLIICLAEECEQVLREVRTTLNMDNDYYSPEYLGWDDEGLACGVLECDSY